jgi:hypothetical protein
MLNDDDSLMVEDDDVQEGTGDQTDEIAEQPAPSSERRPRKKPAARKARKAAKATPKKAPKPAARTVKSGTSKASPPEGFTRVKAGSHSIWLTRELARALSAKDKRKLKALFRKAARRKKSA